MSNPVPVPSEREFDVIVWGATGFAGRLIAEYLCHRDPSLRLAIAGRNRSKLESIRDGLTDDDAGQPAPAVVIAEADDLESLRAMAARSRVVCSAVGPYLEHGLPLLEACVTERTDYCDITGEIAFMRRSIDRHHEAAKRNGTRLVHACGYDSVPSDLGVSMIQEEALRRWGRPLHEIKLYAGETRGAFGGGTIATIIGIADAIRNDPELRKLYKNPYALNPAGEQDGPDGKDQLHIAFDPDIGMWTAPFMMAGTNTRVVRRSNAIRGYPYGRDFRYAEVMSTGRGGSGLVRAGVMTGALFGLFAAIGLEPTRRLLQRTILPAPGEGPSEETMRNGKFVFRLIGKGTDHDGEPVALRAEVIGHADPAFRGTAIMVGEAAARLAQTDGAAQGGVTTPAVALGMPLVERLRTVGMMWTVTDA